MPDQPYPAWIDGPLPPCGPCEICGGPDARHRVIDTIIGNVIAGDSVEEVAADRELSVEFVRQLVEELALPRSG